MTIPTQALSRRQALQWSAVAATGLLIDQPLTAADESSLAIIDCHQHLWDLDKQNLNWLQKGTLPLGRNYVMSDYLAAMEGTGITQAVYMEVNVADNEKIAEGELIAKICQKGEAPTIAAVIGCIPDDPGFADYIQHWQGNKFIKGMRIVLNNRGTGSEHRCLTKAFVKGVQQLGEAGLSFDLCMPAQHLSDGEKLVAACPETKFIVDHCGGADPSWWTKSVGNKQADSWQANMSALAARPNTLCKISGIIANVKAGWMADDLAPAINICLDTFGPKRVVFGSDWPVCLKGAPLKDWVTALRAIIAHRSVEEQRQLLSMNAIREYRLPG